MQTDRRKFLIGAITAVGGASMLASCGGSEPWITKSDISSGKGEYYSEDELMLVYRFVDLLLPKTETAGGIEAEIPAYLDGLMIEWASEDTRISHRNMLVDLKSALDEIAGSDFNKLDLSKAEEVLSSFDATAFEEGTNQPGYIGFKSLIATTFSYTELGAEASGWSYAPPGRWDPNVQKDYS